MISPWVSPTSLLALAALVAAAIAWVALTGPNMPRMKGGLILVTALAVCALFFDIPAVTFILVLGFPPAAFVGWASNTALLYALAFCIRIYVFRLVGIRAVANASALLWVLAIAFVPGYVSESQYHALVRSASAADFSKPPAIQPQTFEIPLEGRPDPTVRSSALSQARPTCAGLCQDLLYNGGAEAVFIAKDPDDQPVKGRDSVRILSNWRFSIEHQDQCGSDGVRVSNEFDVRVAKGDCIIGEPVDAIDADVLVKADNSLFDDHPGRLNDNCQPDQVFNLWSLGKDTFGDKPVLTIYEKIGGVMQPVERRSGFAGFVAPTPFYLGFSCLLVASIRVPFQDVYPVQVLQKRYSLSLMMPPVPKTFPPPGARPDAADQAVYLRILGRTYGPSVAPSGADQTFVANFIDRIGARKTLDESDIDLLRAAVGQPAFVRLGEFNRIAESKQAMDALMPDIVDRIEAGAASGRPDAFLRDLGNNAPPDFASTSALLPYKARLTAVLSNPDTAVYANAFLMKWGEIDDHPVSFLSGFLANKSEEVRENAARGICRFITPEDHEVADQMFTYLRNLDLRSYTALRVAVVALLRADRKSDLEDLVKQAGAADRRGIDVNRVLNGSMPRPDPTKCS